MLNIEDITVIRKAINRPGYEIVFPDNRVIWLIKRRTIAGLLLLIKHGHCSEEDLVGTNNRLAEIKTILEGKYDSSWILNRYGDANKPFSELWTEEGFSCIRAEGLQGNRQYVLDRNDHELLFNDHAKAIRSQLSKDEKGQLLDAQQNRCNLCGSILKASTQIPAHTYAKDRVSQEFDHRIPIEKGGSNDLDNYQVLCHYCNKSKRQICFVCNAKCDKSCVLVSPETSTLISATGEDIADRSNRF